MTTFDAPSGESLLLQCFLHFPKIFNFLSYLSALNLDFSKILSFGKELRFAGKEFNEPCPVKKELTAC